MQEEQKYVVVKNGQRISQPMSESEAQAQAAQLRLQESANADKITVVPQLLG